MLSQAMIYASALNFSCSLADKRVILLCILATIAAAALSALFMLYRFPNRRYVVFQTWPVVAVITALICVYVALQQKMVCDVVLANKDGAWLQTDVVSYGLPSKGSDVILIMNDGVWIMSEIEPSQKPTNGR